MRLVGTRVIRDVNVHDGLLIGGRVSDCDVIHDSVLLIEGAPREEARG